MPDEDGGGRMARSKGEASASVVWCFSEEVGDWGKGIESKNKAENGKRQTIGDDDMRSYLLTFLAVFLNCLGVVVAQPKDGKASWTNSLGMVFVPARDAAARFCIWETRVRDYAVFVREGQWAKAWPPVPFEQTTNDPVVNFSWEESKDFCIWLTERERRMGLITSNQVYRLPSDLEWSAAAGVKAETGQRISMCFG